MIRDVKCVVMLTKEEAEMLDDVCPPGIDGPNYLRWLLCQDWRDAMECACKDESEAEEAAAEHDMLKLPAIASTSN
jgi:hypothetical protein